MPDESAGYFPQSLPPVNCLVVSNCMVYSIAPCLNYLAPHLNVTTIMFNEFNDLAAAGKINDQSIQQCGCVISHPAVESFFSRIKLPPQTRHALLHPVNFNAFHPDLMYLNGPGGLIKTYLGEYQSKLIAASFCLGYSPAKVRELFCEKVFGKLGYFDYWEPAVERMKTTYSQFNFKPDFWVASLLREGCFMHSVNHPHLRVVFSLCSYLLDYLQIPHYRFPMNTTPPYSDMLAGGGVYPIYPEIASYYGFRGDYLFRSSVTKKPIDLAMYIKNCYEVYAPVGADSILSLNTPTLRDIVTVLREC